MKKLVHFYVLTILSTIPYLVIPHYNQTVRVKHPQYSLLGPNSHVDYQVNDVYNQLIDIENFTFKVNPQSCAGYTNGLLLVAFVFSHPNHFQLRTAIRKTWGRPTDTTKTVFLIADIDDEGLKNKVHEESSTFRDIVQGNFRDSYQNLTYKHVMGLKWVTHHCSKAKYVLKVDDDIVVNTPALIQFLTRELSPWGAKNCILCNNVHKNRPVRLLFNWRQKWRVTKEEYPYDYYPKHCSGFAIIYSQDVVQRLLTAAQNIPYFRIEDVFTTGLAVKKIGVNLTAVKYFVQLPRKRYLLRIKGMEYARKFLFIPNVKVEIIYKLWTVLDV